MSHDCTLSDMLIFIMTWQIWKFIGWLKIQKLEYLKNGKWLWYEVKKLVSQRIRRSCPEVFCKEGILKTFGKFTGKHLHQSLFFNKVADLRPAFLLKKSLWHRCFPANFAKFLKAPFLQNTPGGCFWMAHFEKLPFFARRSL